MATSGGIRLTKNDLARMITLYLEAIPFAAVAGLQDAIKAGAETLVENAEEAITETGLREHPEHPGRHDTGRLIQQFMVDGVPSNSVFDISVNSNGNINASFGILDTETVPYIVVQEKGTMDQEGRGSGIPGMMVVQSGFNVLASRLMHDIAVQLAEAGRDAEAGRMYTRSNNRGRL